MTLAASKDHSSTRATQPGDGRTSDVAIVGQRSQTSFRPFSPGKSGPETYTGIESVGHALQGSNGGKTTGSETENFLSIEAMRSVHSSFASQTKSRPANEKGRRRFVAIATVFCRPNESGCWRRTAPRSQRSSTAGPQSGSCLSRPCGPPHGELPSETDGGPSSAATQR